MAVLDEHADSDDKRKTAKEIPRRPRTPRVVIAIIEHPREPEEEVESRDRDRRRGGRSRKQTSSSNTRPPRVRPVQLLPEGNFQLYDRAEDPRQWIEREFRGTHIVLVIQKLLTATDVNSNDKRLFMPKNKLRIPVEDFLDEAERAEVAQRSTATVKRGFSVKVVGPRCRAVYPLKFRRWDLMKDSGRSNIMYVLIRDGRLTWTDFSAANQMVEEEEIQVWSFKVDGERYMAVLVIKDALNK